MANLSFTFSNPFMGFQTSTITYLSCLISKMNSIFNLCLYVRYSSSLTILTLLHLCWFQYILVSVGKTRAEDSIQDVDMTGF